MLDSAIQRISIRETNCAIHWIDFYPVDSAIQCLNNRGQVYKWIPALYCGGYPWAGLVSIPGGWEKYSYSRCFMLWNPGLSWSDGPHDLQCKCMPAGLPTVFFFCTKTSSSARREIRACTRHSSRQ